MRTGHVAGEQDIMAEAFSNVGLLKFLLTLPDTRELGSVALLELAKDARAEFLKKGDILHADEHMDRNLYLVEGEIELVADDQVLQVISGGSDRAHQPLFRVHTHGLHGVCNKPCSFLSLNEATLERYANEHKAEPTQPGFTTVEDDREAEIIEEIRREFHHHEVDLPSMSEVALKINQAVQDESLDFKQIADIIQNDPVISARTVQVANSAMYMTSQPVQTIQRAVQRIGLRAMRTIVISVTLRNLYSAKSPLIKKRMKEYYQHSVRVGVVSHVLTKHIKGFDPEQAFLAGLIHDIGMVPVLVRADNHDEIKDNAELLDRMIADLKPAVGSMLLKQWGFEDELITVVEEAEDWQRQPVVADYCDIVQIAHVHCDMLGGNKTEMPDLDELPAMKRVDLEDTNPRLIVAQSKAELTELMQLFK